MDANNVLHAGGDGRAPDGIARLMAAIMASRYRVRKVVLVCDGSPGGFSPGARAAVVRMMAERPGWRVVHSGPEKEADDVIEEMLATASDASRVTVVSSDARLARAAAKVGASSVKAREFLHELEKDRAKAVARAAPLHEGLDAGSVAWWMGHFGYREPERATRAAHEGDRGSGVPATKSDAPGTRSAPGPHDAAWDWLAEVMRQWPGVQEGHLDMERILKEHGPAKKRKRMR